MMDRRTLIAAAAAALLDGPAGSALAFGVESGGAKRDVTVKLADYL